MAGAFSLTIYSIGSLTVLIPTKVSEKDSRSSPELRRRIREDPSFQTTPLADGGRVQAQETVGLKEIDSTSFVPNSAEKVR